MDALFVALAIAAAAEWAAGPALLAAPGQALPVATFLAVGFATARGFFLPGQQQQQQQQRQEPQPEGPKGGDTVNKLALAGDDLGKLVLYLYFASAGATGGSLAGALPYAAALAPFLAVLYGTHLAFLLLVAGPAAGFGRRELLVASNANIGGPATAASLAAAQVGRFVQCQKGYTWVSVGGEEGGAAAAVGA